MCMGAIQSFRIKRLVYGAADSRLGACGSLVDLSKISHPFHKADVTGGVLAEECATVLRRFFQGIRHERFRHGSWDLGRGQGTNEVAGIEPGSSNSSSNGTACQP